MQGGRGAGVFVDELSAMIRGRAQTDNPALYGWNLVGQGGVAWYRGRFLIQKALEGWGLHEYPRDYHPRQDKKAPQQYRGRFASLEAIEQWLADNGGPGENPRQMSTARALMAAVAQYLTDNYGPVGMRHLPEGLRLELHPLVVRHIMREPGNLGWPDDLSRHFEVPVKVTHDLADGHWRLVVVTEQELLGGRL